MIKLKTMLMNYINEEIEYVVMDPSKNITILVLTKVPISLYGSIAKKLLEVEKSAEQVGFLTFEGVGDVHIHMAGGEFCGNATMSAGVLYAIKNLKKNADVNVSAYGINDIVNVKVREKTYESLYEGKITMPLAKEVKEIKFKSGEIFPVVFFEGIAHIIYDINNFNEELKMYLENNIKEWCDFLEVPALGVMVIGKKQLYESDVSKLSKERATLSDCKDKVSITPLVYVKSVDTLYWENSCASGTTAVGEYLKRLTGKNICIDVLQPGGVSLEVESDENGRMILTGDVKYLYLKRVMV